MKTSLSNKVSRTSKAKTKTLSRFMMTSALVAVGSLGFISPAHAVDFFETPTNPVIAVGNGSAAISTSGFFNQNLNVNQSTERVIIDWNTFNIGAGAKVQFYQPGTSSLAVNRVSNDGQFSSINGRLIANGKVMILDPNGVMFSTGSIIDVGSIVASTGNVNDARVMAGDLELKLNNFGTGEIVNNSIINAKDSGLVAFVGPTVKNNGIIIAKGGRVSLAAGNETATVDLYGDGLVELAYTDKDGDLLAENTGAILAVGGTIQMSAAAAKNIVDSVVNMKGIATVNSVHVQNGKIILSGKKVKVNKNAVVVGDTEINADSADLGTTILGDVTGSSKEVNILSNKAKIAQGLGAVAINGTVNVYDGTYNEHLVVSKKGVTLKSLNGASETTIIPNSPGVTITADNVTIDGLTFMGATGADGYGIYVNGADGVTLRNNIIKGTSQHGIYVLNSSFTNILDNNIGKMSKFGRISGDGIRVESSSDVSVNNNKIVNVAQNGVHAIYVSGLVTINGNTIDNSDNDGILVNGYAPGLMFDGFAGSEFTKKPYLVNGLYVNGNTITDSDQNGISILNPTGYVEVKNNIVTNSGNNGIYVTNYSPSYFIHSSFALNDGENEGEIVDNMPIFKNGLYINLNEISNSGSVMETEYSRDYSNGNGIEVVNANGYVEIAENNISNSGMNGIYVYGYNYMYPTMMTTQFNPPLPFFGNSLELLIKGNFVTDSGSNGVYLRGLNGDLTVSDNEIYNSANNGILVDTVNHHLGDMYYPVADSFLEEGEEPNSYPIYPKSQLIISNNDAIDNSGNNGIYINQAAGYVSVDNNIITDSDSNGIYVYNTSFYYDGFDGGDEIMKSQFMGYPYGYNNPIELYIVDNIISDSGSNGIYVDRASGHVEIKSNEITNSGTNGIYVVNYSPSYYAYPVSARVSEEDTVIPERRDGLYINLNEISNSGSVMETEYSRNNSNGNGIEVLNANGYVEIADNDVYNSGMNGIYVHGYNDSYYPSKSYYGGNNLELLIAGNFVTDSGSNGVYLSGLNGDLTVSNNEIYNSDYNGILVDNVNQNYGDMYYLNKVSILEESEEPEIYPIYPVYPNNQLIISGNDIDNSGYDGVSINQTGGYVSVDNNIITDSGENGIYVYNSSLYYDVIDGGDEMMTSRFMDYPYGYNNPIELHIVDNTVENVGFVPSQDGGSDVAEEAPNGFAAINLDISGDGYAEISGNTLGNNFEYGLYARSGEIDLTGATNTIQNTAIGMGFYPAPKGAPDEDSEGYFDFLASQLKLTNDTIGTTAFVDQSEFFVDLGYGAFFAPGTPTILNGNDATYTLGGATIAPSVDGGVTQAEYDVLEARFNHFVDFQNRGLFFFNILPDPLTFGQEDIFRTFNFPTGFGQGGSLTVTGLPRIAGVAAPVAGGFNPNAIEPAAGDDETTGEDVAGIEPSAGGATNSACWADATQALGQGTPVRFNFGGGSSALLQDAANCGSGTNDQNL